MKKFLVLTPAAIFLGSLAVLIGCGGGASNDSTVTIKPKQSDSSGTTATAGTNNSEDTSSDAAPAEGFGTLRGRVVFEGSAPTLALLIQQGANIKDGEVCAAHDVPNEKLVVDADGGVANVFVYLQRAPQGAKPVSTPEDEVIFDQKNCVFLPHALIMQTGQTVRVLSDDPIAHNTHTFPKRNTTFNQVVAANDRDGIPLVYQQPEAQPIEVKCDFHAWMLAYHLPLDHPFGAVTAEDGTFEITDLPSGTHEFRVWHEGATGGYVARNYKVTINADETTDVEITYPADRFAANARPATKSVTLSSLTK